MKDFFKEYYRPKKGEFEVMWKTCIFTFDANVLLNLYRYSENTSDELLKIIEAIKDRVWLPHQFCLEFMQNRPYVINEQKCAYDQITNALNISIEAFEQAYKKANIRPSHRYFDKKSILEAIRKKVSSLQKNLEKLKKNHPDWIEKDLIQDKISEIFDNRHGQPFKTDKYLELYAEADQRYAIDVPPGYMDMDKDDDDKTKKKKYGDFLAWKQLIEYATTINNKPIILVTDDDKEDWWRKSGNRILGPREELIREMYKESGVGFYMYQTNQFMKYAHEILGIDVDRKTITEVTLVKNLGYEIVGQIDTSQSTVGTANLDNAIQSPSIINNSVPGIAASSNQIEEKVGRTVTNKDK